MKNFRIYIAVLSIALAALVAMVLNAGRSEAGKSHQGAAAQSSKSTGVSGKPVQRNAVLRNELNWVLGGKPQRGWYLYTPLISRLLNTDRDVTSDGFASALARWQKKSGLAASGVLDEETFYAIVAEWQGARLKSRDAPSPDQLITAPISDFYDPTRAEELRQVERQTYAAYKRMVAAAISDRSLGLAHGVKSAKDELAPTEKYLKIISAFRSREYQEKLRRETPNAGRAGLAVNSPHFTGRALDLYVGGEPVETNDPNRAVQVKTRVYLWLVRNAERFGFRPYFYEPWHWEYVK
ncbi:MAG: D-alanyl-D-alanine carboxypeptidase family protein [Acidobacteriota bacterium]|nr:D-alanyl-D-alanine carboxypeptidase family protein [Acidobacteriota bacterium]